MTPFMLPREAGEEKKNHSRGAALRPSFADHDATTTKALSDSPPVHKEGRRSAERRNGLLVRATQTGVATCMRAGAEAR
jgi:hypothetical protein